MTIQLDLMSGLIDSSGIQIGYTLNGFLGFAYGNAQTGLLMQDSAGQYWMLQIDTDGRLGTTPVTL